MAKTKNLSNPFSTGGGGFHFEAHIQASFVVLMLTGGYVPCLPYWPIVEIKLQGKNEGFDTDDLIVFVENPNTKERRKMLGQIKHAVAITRNPVFSEVIQAAWNDFNKSELFLKGKDIITLITGPLSATDEHNVQWLLNQAKHTKNADEFFRHVEQVKFSPPKSYEKLQVIQNHLIAANGGKEVSREDLYSFLNHFYILDYDLGNKYGIVLSLLHSHISQFQQRDPQLVWSRIVDIVQTWDKNAGTITRDKLSEDLLEAFVKKAMREMPEAFNMPVGRPRTDLTQHPDATYLALATLIGAWNEKNKCDIEVVSQILGIDYDTWLQKAREILHLPNSPLSLKNGIWTLSNRAELWESLGSRILDKDLETFKSIAVNVLKEIDPVFELPVEKRYAASIYGKTLNYSRVLRNGIAEGLAILGNQPQACNNCSFSKPEGTVILAVRDILAEADWVTWGSLNDLLPILAEAAPDEFLRAVENALRMPTCPFDQLFMQEGRGTFGSNYLTGLLWALEGLAWDEQYLVRVCVVLGELASRDPGGQWANRPSNSLATIFLPWYPQTLASIDKRKAAVETLLKECPDASWNLIIQLLPGQLQSSSGTYKPKWRKVIIPEDWEKGVTREEYWQQVQFYTELAVKDASNNISRLSELIDHFASLPQPAFEQLIEVLSSQSIIELSEDQRLMLWDHLRKIINKHRRFSDAEWALPGELVAHIEKIAEKFVPGNPLHRYKYLFTDRDFDLYEKNSNWEEQRKVLKTRREAAIMEIFHKTDIEGVIRFAESVVFADQVGYALDVVTDETIEQVLLPSFLDAADIKHKDLVRGFIWSRFYSRGWKWCDAIDKSEWTPKQLGCFLASLPFTKEVWDRATQWLQEDQGEYWSRVNIYTYQASDDLTIAIEKLIEHGRPYAAINCLGVMLFDKQPINTEQCVRALLAALSSSEPTSNVDQYNIIELIEFLQSESSVTQEDLFRVEWAYLPLLDGYSGAEPKLLENKLANDPEFFCEVIRLIYRSKKEKQPFEEPAEAKKAIAENAWRLLYGWRTPPGTQEDGTFSAKHFNEWLQRVKDICIESGHIEVALIKIGEVLIYAPPDPDGLWIHRAVATALNDRYAEDMRDGYRTGAYNSRGVYSVDPSGKPERELAEQFRRKAEEVENAGFQRFASTLRDLAATYEREAERIIDEHRGCGDD